MKTEQRTITVIVAEEGKLLRRKSDGWIAGEQVTLGYNYYESGMGLESQILEIPDDYEEIDAPEDFEQPLVIDHAIRIKRMQEIVNQTKKDINTFGLSNSDSLKVKDFYPEWSDKSLQIKKGDKYRYADTLYEADQDHTSQSNWNPSVMSSLWHEVVEDHSGTLEDPIPYNEELNPMWQGMVLEEGKYYTQNKIVYKCIRGTGNKVTHNLADLISGGFVEKV